MGCSTCAKVFLVVVNVIFLIIGLAFLITGCLLRFGQVKFLNDQIMLLLGDGSDVSFNSLVGVASLALIIAGAIIFVVGCLGVFGTVCSVKWMIIMYVIVVIIIVLAEVTCVILLFTLTAQAEAFIQGFLKDTFKTTYQGTVSTDAITQAWNFIFGEFDCCGISGYTDTHAAVLWNRTVVDPVTSDVVTLQTPLTCCKDNGTNIDWSSTSFDCAVMPNSITSNYQAACYDVIKEKILHLSGYFIGISVGILVIELLLIAAGIGVYKSIDSKVQPFDGRPRKA